MLLQLQATILRNSTLRDVLKAKLLEELAHSDIDLVEGADEHLQLLAVGSSFRRVLVDAMQA